MGSIYNSLLKYSLYKQEPINYTKNYYDALTRSVKHKYSEKDAISFTFQVTEGCTLACKYCYQHDKTPKRMSGETAKKVIDRLFVDLKDTHFAVTIEFIGGEPLLEPELISKIVDYYDYQCIMHYPEIPGGMYNVYDMCSNGTEGDKPEVQKLMNKIKGRLSFSVSIDGNKELHDSARVHPDGSGSYDEAIHAAKEYEKLTSNKLGSKMTIAPSNVGYTCAALKHYLDSGETIIHANTVYEDVWKQEDAILFYKELKKLSDYKIEKYPLIYLSLFEDNMFEPTPEDDNQPWCGGNGRMLACDTAGTFYPCLRYMPSSVGQDRTDYITCGDCNTKLDWSVNKEMQKCERKEYSDEECFNCPISRGCGDCTAYRWEKFGTIWKRTKFHCEMHKARALANVYYWNNLYLKYDIPEYFEMHCPKDWALKIIDEDEYQMLLDLVEKAKEHAKK